MPAALRPLEPADGSRLLSWRNSPEVARFMLTDHAIAGAEHEAWLERALVREDARHWIVTLDAAPAGFTSLTEIDARQGTCNWAVYIGEAALRGRGLGGFALFAALEQALVEMGLRKLCCEVVDGNDVALGVYEHYGLAREGRLREQILKDGRPLDVHRLGILDREWRARRDQHRAALRERGLL